MGLFEENCCVDVNGNPELCAKLQEALFKRGYSWAGDKNVKNLNANSLFFRTSGSLLYSTRRIEELEGLGVEYKELSPKDVLEGYGIDYTDSSII